MSTENPNRLVMNHGSTFAAHFGAPYHAAPTHPVSGLGHEPKIKVSFFGGLSIELTRAAAIELARRLPEAIASLPIETAGIHDAVGGDTA